MACKRPQSPSTSRMQYLTWEVARRWACHSWIRPGKALRPLSAPYFRQADGVMIVFDVGRRSSFERVITAAGRVSSRAIRTLQSADREQADVPENERMVSDAEAQALADEHGWLYFAASAKSGVQDAFYLLACTVMNRLIESDPKNILNNETETVALGGKRKEGRLVVVEKRCILMPTHTQHTQNASCGLRPQTALPRMRGDLTPLAALCDQPASFNCHALASNPLPCTCAPFSPKARYRHCTHESQVLVLQHPDYVAARALRVIASA